LVCRRLVLPWYLMEYGLGVASLRAQGAQGSAWV